MKKEIYENTLMSLKEIHPGWRPTLAPNNPSSETPDYETLLNWDQNGCLSNYHVTKKLDGIRVELFNGRALSRELKLLGSEDVQMMAELVHQCMPDKYKDVILEGEIWAPGFSRSEISHFVKSENVNSSDKIRKYTNLWHKTAKGTIPYTKKVKGVDTPAYWPYQGRDLEFVTTFPRELKFHLFDVVLPKDQFLGAPVTKEDRFDLLIAISNAINSSIESINEDLVEVVYKYQSAFMDFEGLMSTFDSVLAEPHGEGLMLVEKTAQLKSGRYTFKSGKAFKLKNDTIAFTGKVLGVVEGTVAKEGSAKTISALGRSKTSQLKEDREPSGMASGLLVEMEDKRTLTVGLTGYDHSDRRALLKSPQDFIGQIIVFFGMESSKVGGMPVQSHYVKPRV